MDLLVMRERPRRGIRNSGYDVSPLPPTPFSVTNHHVPVSSSSPCTPVQLKRDGLVHD